MHDSQHDTDVILDAMPYADNDMAGPEINSLISHELAEILKNAETTEEMSEIFANDEILNQAWQTVLKGEKLEKKIDTTRYRLPIPEKDDVKAWKEAVDNAKAQLEAQHNRLINLELLAKFGANAWKLHNHQLDKLSSSLVSSLESFKAKSIELNKLRKYEQIKAGAELQHLELEWGQQMQSIVQLRMALHQLDTEIEQLEHRNGE